MVPQRLIQRASVFALATAALLSTTASARAQEQEDLLSCLGALSASHVYITYGYVGSVADGFADGRYDADHVMSLMAEVDGLMGTVVDHLSTVRNDAAPNEQASIDQIIECCELLQDEASALARIAKDDTQNNREAFEAARNDAWDQIAALLKIGAE